MTFIYFLGLPWEFFFWCHYRWFITSLALEKCKRECNILWIILVQDFCPLKIKITHSPIPGKSFQTLRETCFECTQMSASQSPYQSTSFDKIFAAIKQVYLINFINFCFFILLDGNTRATFDGLNSEKNYKFNSIKQHT